jgi:hypothetical protein
MHEQDMKVSCDDKIAIFTIKRNVSKGKIKTNELISREQTDRCNLNSVMEHSNVSGS